MTKILWVLLGIVLGLAGVWSWAKEDKMLKIKVVDANYDPNRKGVKGIELLDIGRWKGREFEFLFENFEFYEIKY